MYQRMYRYLLCLWVDVFKMCVHDPKFHWVLHDFPYQHLLSRRLCSFLCPVMEMILSFETPAFLRVLHHRPRTFFGPFLGTVSRKLHQLLQWNKEQSIDIREPRLQTKPKRSRYKAGSIKDATSYNFEIDKTHLGLGFISSNVGCVHISTRTRPWQKALVSTALASLTFHFWHHHFDQLDACI